MHEPRGSRAGLACKNGDFKVLKRLRMRRGADLARMDEHGQTALFLAYWHGHTAIVRVLVLLQHGANVTRANKLCNMFAARGVPVWPHRRGAVADFSRQRTAVACQCDHMARLLIEHGAVINQATANAAVRRV